MQKKQSKSELGLLALVMMAIISVDSLRNLPIAAQFGASLVTFYAVAGLGFFLPLAWVTTKLATHYPKTGGSYIWIREAFGHNWGHFAICLQWLYNMIWYPTIFAFITATVAVLLGHHLDQSKWFVFVLSLVLFWFLSWIHSFGLRFSKWVNIGSAVVGTLLPMGIIICLAGYWILEGKPIATPMSHWQNWIPTFHDMKNIGFFSNVLFSLLGLEVIAVYAGSVVKPKTTYPKALAIAAVLILLTLLGSSLALCVIMPVEKIAVITGLVDVLQIFFAAFHLQNMTFLIGFCIIIGGLGIASSWMLGLAKSLHISLSSMSMTPQWMQKLNRNQVPTGILWLQGGVYTVLLCAFLFFPSLNRSYWILSAATAQFALLYYIILFCAAMKLLRAQSKTVLNIAFPVLAMVMCGIGLAAGFIPPEL
ncbi:MAG: amino acid permease [Legionellaceae bacterium]|nr:amino acid permease [Legionellaceae bacterium]MBP9774944.1 amino acid permease [Legionellaceae bacterium]